MPLYKYKLTSLKNILYVHFKIRSRSYIFVMNIDKTFIQNTKDLRDRNILIGTT